ncbi:hypothetical protein ACFCWT_13340 [Streptomyces olivaceus]|uniref:hypothetical protein n=1 Tax=Streptomyces olivaceus TaxID=47716 RepID=UPI0035D9B84A
MTERLPHSPCRRTDRHDAHDFEVYHRPFWCPGFSPAPVPPANPSVVREQLLHAIDFAACQTHGYGTPEELLAAYDASVLPGRAEYDALVADADRLRRDGAALHARAEAVDEQLAVLRQQVAAPVDPAALRETVAAALVTTRRTGYDGAADHRRHRYDARCALCAGDVDALAAAVTAAVLPATTGQTAERCLSCEHEARYHDVDGRCWFTVEQGVFERDSVCSCLLRRVADETAATETDEERADREETERDHGRGDHTYCGITCAVELPTEHLRNFVIAKGYPGTKGALAELERRAAAGARQDGASS